MSTDEPLYAPGRKPSPPRQPNPGEVLMTFERGQDVYRCELRETRDAG